MIIKLPIPFILVKPREEKIIRPLTFEERVKTDRLVMAILFTLTVVGAAVFA